MQPKEYVVLAAIALFTGVSSFAQVKQVQLKNFQLQSSTQVSDGGKLLSSPDYQPAVSWYKARVPSTVLTALVKNNIYPDPYTGLNNMLIPDASDEFNVKYGLEKYSYLPNVKNPWKNPYWYRTQFFIPESDKGKLVQLIFDGINYRAEVWLNGSLIADSSQMVGMFRQFTFDVSKFIITDSRNCLAVKIFPLDFPGLPATEQLQAFGPFYENGGPTGDIGKNVTMLCSAGWDWIPPVRDRNMGIWQPVYLRTTGNATLENIHLTTDLPNLSDTSVAKLSLSLSVENHANSAVNGNLKVTVSPENFTDNSAGFTVNYPVQINALNNTHIELKADNVNQFLVNNPKLWWCNGYGAPNLYRIKIQLFNGNSISDEKSFLFGIRTVSSQADDVNGMVRRTFFINGKKIHLVGGAWVPDMMLNRDSLRNDYELHLCQNANMNLIRIWGGGVTPEEPFWQACDRYGLLVWNDFWITGDTQGEFKGSPDYPLQGDVFIANVKSSILCIRNHPSLLVWTGGNEGHARKELYDAMRQAVIDLDGTRPFIPSSSGWAKMAGDWLASYPDNKPAGVYSGGPYSWKDPKYYYRLADTAKDWVFKDETGIPSLPPLNTLKKIIPNFSWDTTLRFPFNHTWGYHDACTGAAQYDHYYDDMTARYGAVMNVDSFANKMQLMNAAGYQGIFEAANSRIDATGGVMLWKLNPAFPSVVWQIYDWYLMPNAGYYFIQNACEPLHVQFNQRDSSIAVVNRTRFTAKNATATAQLFSIDGKKMFEQSGSIKTVDYDNFAIAFSMKTSLQQHPEFNFILLSLKNGEGKMISKNVYWTAKDNNYTALNTMPQATVQAEIVNSTTEGNERVLKIKVKNSGSQIAFFTRLQVMQKGEEITPCFWSDNYMTLAPDEEKTLTVRVPIVKTVHATSLRIDVSGWNVKTKSIHLK